MIERSFVKGRVGEAAVGPWCSGPRLALLGAFLGVLLLGACAHRTNPAQELNSAVGPFTDSRDQTIKVVAQEKHSLGAADLNSLAVVYTPLEEKANAYAHFLVISVSSASFNADQNNQCASDLTAAIDTFNKAFAKIVSSKQTAPVVSSAWVAPFAANVASYWGKYGTGISGMSSQTRADVTNQLRNKTLWPNYEDIATEPLATPSH
ncbi:MAG: hypothetical protein WB609_08850 [Candidatus Cybelea sp.]